MKNLKEAVKRGYINTGAKLALVGGTAMAALPAWAGEFGDAAKDEISKASGDVTTIGIAIIAVVAILCCIGVAIAAMRKV